MLAFTKLMGINIVTRRALRCLASSPNPIFFSTVSRNINPNSSKASQNSQYRKQISLASLLQRYGFAPSQLSNILTKNRFLFNSDINDIKKSLGILLSFKIPQKSLVSLISECPAVLEFEFLKKWENGVFNFGQLSVTPSMIKSVLEHSRRYQIDPDRFCRTVMVLKGLGLSDCTARRVLEEYPNVVSMNERDICTKIDFWLMIGVQRDGIDWVIYTVPQILGFSVEGRLKPLLDEFWNLGFSEDEIRKEIVRNPRILDMELGEISRCLELLRTLKCRPPIKHKIFSDGAFRAGFEVKLRVDLLCKHGLIRREAFKVLWKEPRLITYDIGNIEKKIDFLVRTMKYDVDSLVDVPEYLGVNFEKQIIPRYNVIEYLRSKGALAFEVGLRDLIKPSRLRFYNLFVKPYPECEKMFGRYAGDVMAKSEHPVGMWKLFKPQKHQESKEDVKNIKSFMETLR